MHYFLYNKNTYIKVLCNYVVYEIKQRIIYYIISIAIKPSMLTTEHDSAAYHLDDLARAIVAIWRHGEWIDLAIAAWNEN